MVPAYARPQPMPTETLLIMLRDGEDEIALSWCGPRESWRGKKAKCNRKARMITQRSLSPGFGLSVSCEVRDAIIPWWPPCAATLATSRQTLGVIPVARCPKLNYRFLTYPDEAVPR
jgi:hypothetical protein